MIEEQKETKRLSGYKTRSCFARPFHVTLTTVIIKRVPLCMKALFSKTPHIDLQKLIFGFHSNNWLETTISLAIKWNVEFFSESSHTGVHHVPVHVDSSEEATSLPSYCKR